jgi:hypothetical protein
MQNIKKKKLIKFDYEQLENLRVMQKHVLQSGPVLSFE